MNSWDDLGGGPSEAAIQDRVQRAVEAMLDSAGRAKHAGRIDAYVERLKHLGRVPELFEVLEHAADKCECPSPAAIKETIAKIREQKKPAPQLKPLTEEETARSRQAALKTALWLHYEHGLSLSDFGQQVLGAALKRQESITDAEIFELLQRAKRKHPREEIQKWMNEVTK